MINMVVELISVGTEILMGNIINTNAAYLSGRLADQGMSVYFQDVVGDNEERLKETLSLALSRSDIVILSGGLGPTPDDLTKEVAAKTAGVNLYMDEACKSAIGDYFNKIGRTPTDNNWKQALMPEGGVVLPNHNGTAPGCIIKTEDGKHIILLPGPPEELKPMFEESVVPYLNELMPGVILSKTVKLCGIGESSAAQMIADLIDNQSNPTIATYAKTGEVHIRISAKADSQSEAKKLLKPMVKDVKERFAANIYTTEDDVTLEKAVVDLLVANDLTVGTVESCTGGLLAGRLINVPGVSDVFKSGIVTYSNKSKRRLVGVKKATLDKYGAVSAETAKEMARGLAALGKADVAVAVTGIAGPDGGTTEKPVGLVYIACDVCGKTRVRECHFTGNRQKIRDNSVVAALNLMRECILEYFSEKTFGKQQDNK